MRAVVCRPDGEATVETLAEPTAAAGEVVVAVERVQLSVTECRLFRGDDIAHRAAVDARLASGPSRLFGHEFCATVTATGAGIDRLEVGDRVYAPGKLPCNSCRSCEAGHENACPDRLGIGYELPGALAERVELPAAPLRRVPETVSAAECTALQPLASALVCVLDADIGAGDTVVAVGTGAMGYGCGQLARRFGAGRVIAVDLNPAVLEVAAAQGFETVDANERNPVAAVAALTDGIGADVVFEAVGGAQPTAVEPTTPLGQAFRMARVGGRVVQVGHLEGEVAVEPRRLRADRIDWITPGRGLRQLSPALDTGQLAARLVGEGAIDVDSLVGPELAGLEAFDRAVAIGLDPAGADALGPAQLVVG
jgi:threonine dehydrogenase-like Zn-dependent dehydrogenase